MATNTAGGVGRQYQAQMIHYLRKSISYTDDGSSLLVGTLPAGATILYPISGIQVDVAFNGNSSNIADIGITGTAEKYASDLALGTIAFVGLDVSAVSRTVSADTEIYVAVTSTASASAGNGEVIIAYIPDNDG